MQAREECQRKWKGGGSVFCGAVKRELGLSREEVLVQQASEGEGDTQGQPV